MSASVIQFFYDAMRSMEPAALAASFRNNVVVIEPPPLPYGGTTTSRDEFFEKVLGYTDQRSTFRLVSSEVFGDGDRLAGHFTATFTAHGSGESFLLDQTELYEVTDGAISKVEVFQRDTPGLIDFFARNGPSRGASCPPGSLTAGPAPELHRGWRGPRTQHPQALSVSARFRHSGQVRMSPVHRAAHRSVNAVQLTRNPSR